MHFTAWRTASRAGVQAPTRNVSFSNGVSVPPKILIPCVLRAQRQLLQSCGDLFGGHLFLRFRPAVTQIVGPQQHDGMRDAGLRQNIAVKSAQAAVAADVSAGCGCRRGPGSLHDQCARASMRAMRRRASWSGQRQNASCVEILASVSKSPTATMPPVSAGAHTSMPVTKYQSSVIRPTGITSAAEKSPGGET